MADLERDHAIRFVSRAQNGPTQAVIAAQKLRDEWSARVDIQLQLRAALLMCRMSADSNYLVNKEGPG